MNQKPDKLALLITGCLHSSDVFIDMPHKTLFWFTNDLRLHDHPALAATADDASLCCVFFASPRDFTTDKHGNRKLGQARWRFLKTSLDCLNQSLKQFGQTLITRYTEPEAALNEMIEQLGITRVVRTRQHAFDEVTSWVRLKERHPSVTFDEFEGYTLYRQADLPSLSHYPDTFSKFRRRVESLPLRPLAARITKLPPAAAYQHAHDCLPDADTVNPVKALRGGEDDGLKHLAQYFESSAPKVYKETRNALMGWDQSTRFSPWLAAGCVSPRMVMSALQQFECRHGANESTYWIFFELLWREYFQWYATCHGARLFRFSGLGNRAPLTSFYAERFSKWRDGQTPWPIVNACMNELNATGYLSNRGRQIVASCFVNELSLDWRVGAAYFEQQLIDYDPASNWGNWQYIAGVGADPRGGRHFNLEKQAAQFDPHNAYVKKWLGKQVTRPLDSVGIDDWPIMPD